MRLGVDGAPGPDERADVGDRIAHPVATVAPLQVHGLVEVGGAGRVDGQERQVGEVVRREVGALHGLLGLGEHRGRELGGKSELLTDPGEPGPQLTAGGRVLDAQGEMATRHPGRLRNCPGAFGMAADRGQEAGFPCGGSGQWLVLQCRTLAKVEVRHGVDVTPSNEHDLAQRILVLR